VESFIRPWRDDDRWGRFFYPANHCVTELFRLGRDEALVVHETHECVMNNPPWTPADSTFFLGQRGATQGEFWHGCAMFITDPRAADVARGSSQTRLEQAIDAAAGTPDVRTVVVHQGCLPLLMGDNPTAALLRQRAKRPDTKLYWLAPTNDFMGYTAQLIHDRLIQVAPPSRSRDPLGVGIIGGASPVENLELAGLLRQVGLRPLGVILPSVSFEAVSRVADASVLAWANQSSLRDVAEVFLEGLPVRLLRPSAPVGIVATLDWLEQCVAAAQADPAPLAQLRRQQPWLMSLSGLRQRASQHRLALVGDPEELDLLIDTRPGHAFSLLDALLEMGFAVRLLGRGQEGAFRATRARLEAHSDAARLDLRHFVDRQGLHEQLSDSGVSAVYSNFTADPRAARAGLRVFSEGQIELGIDGFLRTAGRLIHLCEKRPLAGLRSYLGELP